MNSSACAGPRAELRIELVRSFDRLEAVRTAWDELWERAPAATPFSTPAWLIPWWRHLGGGCELSAVLAWRGRELSGFAPTFVYPEGGERVLGLLGGGLSDYQDVLVEDDSVAAALFSALAHRRGAFDRAELRALPIGSPAVRCAMPDGFAVEVSQDDVCPTLPLPPSFDGLAARASPKLLYDVRHQRRRLTRGDGYEIHRATSEDWQEVLRELLRLHAARWRSRGQLGTATDSGVVRFHHAAAHALLDMGLLRLEALRTGGRTAGVIYVVRARDRAYAYLQGIDPAATRWSPGNLLIAHALEAAIGEGAREFDFLRGREPYKYRWGAVDRATLRVRLTPRDRAPVLRDEKATTSSG